MKFLEISEGEYRKFWKKSPQKTFLSAPEMAKMNERGKNFFFGVEKSGKIVAAAMVRGTKNRLNRYNFYAPRGVLVDYADYELLEFFVKNLKERLKKEGGVVLRVEPYVIPRERDIDGKIVEGGEEHLEEIKNIEKAGFKKVPYVEGVSQICWQFVLDVKGKSEEEIWNEIHAKTQKRIKQAETYGVWVEELDYDQIGEFYDVFVGTAGRRGFEARNLAYFQKMYKNFHDQGEIKYISVKINPKKTIALFEKNKEEILKRETNSIREKHEKANALKSANTKIERIKTMFSGREDEDITLSSGMFLTMKPEILHLFGGNEGKYMKLDGQYILQWEMIKMAREQGYDRYNFYGIAANIDKKPQGYGVYEFKRGFSGKVEELAGEYDLPLRRGYYLRGMILRFKRFAVRKKR